MKLKDILIGLSIFALGFSISYFLVKKTNTITKTVEVKTEEIKYRDTCATKILIDSIKIYTEIRKQKVAAWKKLQGSIIAVKEDARPLPCAIDTSTIVYTTDEGLAHIDDTLVIAGTLLSFTRGISVDTLIQVKEIPVERIIFENVPFETTITKNNYFKEEATRLYWHNAVNKQAFTTGLGVKFKNNFQIALLTSVTDVTNDATLQVNVPLFKFNKQTIEIDVPKTKSK